MTNKNTEGDMEELRIAIDVMKSKLFEEQEKIHDMFSYGKWPSNETFLKIKPIADEIAKIHACIEALQETLDCVEINLVR